MRLDEGRDMFAGSQSGARPWTRSFESQRAIFDHSVARRFGVHAVLVAAAGIARPVGARAAYGKKSVHACVTARPPGSGVAVFTGEGSQSIRVDAHHAGAGAAAIQFRR